MDGWLSIPPQWIAWLIDRTRIWTLQSDRINIVISTADERMMRSRVNDLIYISNFITLPTLSIPSSLYLATLYGPSSLATTRSVIVIGDCRSHLANSPPHSLFLRWIPRNLSHHLYTDPNREIGTTCSILVVAKNGHGSFVNALKRFKYTLHNKVPLLFYGQFELWPASKSSAKRHVRIE